LARSGRLAFAVAGAATARHGLCSKHCSEGMASALDARILSAAFKKRRTRYSMQRPTQIKFAKNRGYVGKEQREAEKRQSMNCQEG
jgi:hypothetical protein